MGNNDSALAAFITGASQTMMTLFGVDYYAMLWSFVGSLVALTQTKAMTRPRALLYVCLSTLIGAALGTGAVAFLGANTRAFLLVCSLVGGAGSQLLVAALLQVALSRIKSFGGASSNEQPSQPAP